MMGRNHDEGSADRQGGQAGGSRRKKAPRQTGDGPRSGEGEQGPAPTVEAKPAASEEARSAESLQGRLLRLQADFENFRKRTLREKDELYRRANEDLMLEVLPVLDHLACDALPANTANNPGGFDLQ